jgi:SRSO17 transposase
MTRDKVRAAARNVAAYFEMFRSVFGRHELQAHAQTYLKGLLSCMRRKTCESIALGFAETKDSAPCAEKEVIAMQSFITQGKWEAGEAMQKVQAVFADELAPSCDKWSIGLVGVLDESGFEKSGTESVGVARQYCGRLGKVDNCQVGVYLIGVTPDGTCPLDQQLFLPKEWIKDRARRRKTQVPREITYQSKPKIAAEMIRRTHEAGHVKLDWITGDSLYGDSGPLRTALEATGQRYLLAVRSNLLVWFADPGDRRTVTLGTKRRKKQGHWRHPDCCCVEELAETLPADAWQAMQVREGSKGPLVYEFAAVPIWMPKERQPAQPGWAVFRRSPDRPKEVDYYFSNASEETTLDEFALVTSTRWRVEEYFEDAKTHLGMADYETRAWTSWHHHMALVALAHFIVTLTRRDVKDDVPDFTLSMAVRILQSTFARDRCTEDDAITTIEYYLRRNEAAHQSHRKSWLHKHKRIKAKTLL